MDTEQSNEDVPMRAARRRAHPKRAILALLALLLSVNLAASLYQLPVNRVIERRFCREYYTANDPSVIGDDGSIDESFCKIDAVQQRLAWLMGIMETSWIVGGESGLVQGIHAPLTRSEKLTPIKTLL